MEILHDISLKPYNTFGIDVNAKSFVEIRSLEDLKLLFQSASILPQPEANDDLLILGGGSNVLFIGDFEGLVLKIAIKGIEINSTNGDEVVVKAGAGENWDHFVEYCVKERFYGLENLSGIPGNVGAAPIQNIGAYGAEMKDCFESLEAYDIKTGDKQVFKGEDCDFGYRDSIFNHEWRGRFIILSVSFRLSKRHKYKLTYKALGEKLSGVPDESITLEMIREAVLSIRESKLPDPGVLGNAGSFFKNPTVHKGTLDTLQKKYPEIAFFTVSEDAFKIAAGWMIERCGWKGYREGDAGVHDRQALVLVNHGKANGQQIMDLAMKIRSSVSKKFGILLEPEVRII